MTKKNFVKEKLFSKQSVVGIWSIINSPTHVDIAAQAGLDFQILDMEHGVFDLTSLEHCIRACEARECSPLVRTPGLDQSVIQYALDLGAHGIMVPQIKNDEEGRCVVQGAKFPPLGLRGFNPFTAAGCYNPTLPLASTKLRNDFGLTAVIIENKKSYADLDKIAAIPELDLLYIGIYDYSFDIGLAGDVTHPDVLAFTAMAIKKIQQAGKFSGVMVKNEEEMKNYLDLGVNFIVYGVDSYTYFSAIEKKMNLFKNYLRR